MMIVCHHISCSGCNGTIYKLVIVRVGSDKMELVIRGDELSEWTFHNGFYYQCRSLLIGEFLKNLEIFFNDFI